MALTEFGKEIVANGAHPYIKAALRRKNARAKLLGVGRFICNDVSVNALSAGYQLFRMQPQIALIQQPIIAETEPGSSRALLKKFLNDTLERKVALPQRDFTTERPFRDPNGYCGDFEHQMVQATNTFDEAVFKVFQNEIGDPLFIQKFPPNGESTALSLETTSMWGVAIPAGSVVQIESPNSSPEPSIPDGVAVVDTSPDHISGVYPLRLSRYALSTNEQKVTFGIDRSSDSFPLNPDVFTASLSHFRKLAALAVDGYLTH